MLATYKWQGPLTELGQKYVDRTLIGGHLDAVTIAEVRETANTVARAEENISQRQLAQYLGSLALAGMEGQI